ncbi:hypothetical protein LTR97_007247 [Elasticomyces elasticus]|uniref:Peptidase A1 domain-containing protein n=1 Tax=Elasticomyces elasticus TaxID=574655 RepID=A0AAN7W7M7_9PEZI|nr:hypothetical protein LTR97_007247 [Elasticomyces elasticus]
MTYADQILQLLPSPEQSHGHVVLSEGCWEALPGLPDCTDARGGTFTRNLSASWSTERLPNSGLINLNTFEEDRLGLSGSAYCGFDTVSLGLGGQDLPTLQNQLVAGIATANYFLGSLGLSPISFNISSLYSPVPSILGTLRNESLVPSLSWAYSAGAPYRSPPDYGSLVLGGYDDALLSNDNVLRDVHFSGDASRDLQLQLQNISHDTLGSTLLLSEEIDVFIDSMVSQLWLPLSVCKNFEEAFNLTWDSTQQLYLLDEETHSALLAQNPAFTLGLGSYNGDSIMIQLPYAAFDLNATQPLANTSSYLFPLKRAQNSTQYTLGRMFLQEAYIVADYSRHTFSISPITNAKAAQKLVPICDPDERGSCRGNQLSAGAIGGIAVAVVILVLVIVILAWNVRKRRARHVLVKYGPVAGLSEEKDQSLKSTANAREAELDGNTAAVYEMDYANEFRPELSADRHGQGLERQELADGSRKHEMGTPELNAAELEASLG